MQLFSRLDRDAGAAENVFYSPMSVEQAFGLIHAGSAGETRVQLESFFGWPEGIETERLLERQREDLLGHRTDADIRLANALWLSDSFNFRDSYVSDTAKYYDATARTLDFSAAGAPASADIINGWASEQTEGLIPEVITPDALTDMTAAVLTNALYFEAEWKAPFDSSQMQPFLFGDGREEEFRLMRETDNFALVEHGEWRAVRLPYRGDRFAMDVIMPERRRVMEVAPSLAEIADLSASLGAADAQLVTVSLPRFEVDLSAGLVDPLRSLGLDLPFDRNRADLSAMAEPGQQRIYVGDARQLTRLQVYEEGTKAAAVTVVRIVLTGGRAMAEEPEVFTVDRPFIAVIRDLETNEILFIGRIAEPVPFEPQRSGE